MSLFHRLNEHNLLFEENRTERVIYLFSRPSKQKKDARATHATGIALSYSVFLFLSLLLALFLYLSTISSARHSYWDQQAMHLKTSASSMNTYLDTLSNYYHQLTTDSTLIRLANMEGITDRQFVLTAWQVMQTLKLRTFGLLNMPVTDHHLYLSRSGYVISPSQFTEGEQFYRAYRVMTPGLYEDFLAELNRADGAGIFAGMSAYTGRANSVFLICNLDQAVKTSFPAIIWFELDMDALEKLFISPEMKNATVLIDARGSSQQLVLGVQDAELISAMQAASYNAQGMADYGSMKLIRCQDGRRSYTLALPQSLCSEVVNAHDGLFVLIFLLAVGFGCLMIIALVRHNMRPLHLLSSQLTQAEDDKAQLQREIDAQKPLLSISYVRKLISGHVSSQEEFSYMMDYLGLSGSKHYYVLYCIANRQESEPVNTHEEYDLLTRLIDQHLTTSNPLFYYTTLDRSFVILITYDNSQTESLNDLQQRVINLHNELSTDHDIWFHAGVGGRRDQASQLWESYEQARMAARYTARHHVFLPYDYIRKDTDSWYYPIEISAKLLHFITTGNREQVTDLMALLRKENLEARSLSVPLLDLLLSDLKNTLFKARFQITPPADDELRNKLHLLDERLYASPTFPLLESNALALCDFFVKSTTPSDPIPEIEIYLQENFTDPSLCLSMLGERFNISESYLSHLFKDRTGVNFSVYLERLRMEEAARRLKAPDCNLSTLYADLGYSSAATFRRAFKKIHGITPSEMRGK